MKIKDEREKLWVVMKNIYQAFNPTDMPLKVKVICAVIGILLSLLITLIKIAIR